MSNSVHRLLRFGLFEINIDTQELRNAGTLVKLSPQPFKLLEMLASRSGQVVTREEIQKQLWGDDTYVDFERSVHKCINQIRHVLNDNPERPLYLETLPRKGYRFLAPVTSKHITDRPKVRESGPMGPDTAELYRTLVRNGQGSLASPPNAGAPGTGPAEDAAGVAPAGSGVCAKDQVPGAGKAMAKPFVRRWPRRLLASMGLSAVALGGVIFYWHSQKAHALMEKDTVILADFANSTGEAVFDDTLKQALRIQLEQSPFLNLVPDQKVNATLKLAGRSAGERLTPELTRDICQRLSSKAMLAGSIAQLGSEYVVSVQAVNCQTGDVLAEALEQARNKEDVLKALDRAALSVRRKLGESLRTVQNFATPVEEATTSSLDALKAYSLATKLSHEKGFAAALPYDELAVQLDPKFALAYFQMGSCYHNLNESERATEYYTKAFELRKRTSEPEKLIISAAYYQMVTAELDKSAQVYQEMIDNYPRRYVAYQNLSVVYAAMGQYDKALELAKQAAALPPERIGEDENVITFLLALQQLEQAGKVILQETQARKLDMYTTHSSIYAIGFLNSDAAIMTEQLRWFASKDGLETYGLSLESDSEAYAGHLHRARELSAKAVDSAVRTDNVEDGATWAENRAVREAGFGNSGEAQRAAAAGLKLDPKSRNVQAAAAVAYALSADTARAESIIRDLNASYPLDTQVQSLWLPAIRAQIALNRKNPAEAINQLQHALPPIEYGSNPSILQVTCLYPTYIRGQAYLASRQGAAAALEFQKILDRSGMVWNCWTGALAHLGLARANALQANTSQGTEAEMAHARAVGAYNDFVTLWKDADPDVPIYKQAKAEYASLK